MKTTIIEPTFQELSTGLKVMVTEGYTRYDVEVNGKIKHFRIIQTNDYAFKVERYEVREVLIRSIASIFRPKKYIKVLGWRYFNHARSFDKAVKYIEDREKYPIYL